MKMHLKSIFEQVSDKVFNARTLTEGQQIITEFVNSKKIDDNDKQTIIKNVNECKTLIKLQTYICNSLLTYEQLGLNQLNKSAKQAVTNK